MVTFAKFSIKKFSTKLCVRLNLFRIKLFRVISTRCCNKMDLKIFLATCKFYFLNTQKNFVLTQPSVTPLICILFRLGPFSDLLFENSQNICHKFHLGKPLWQKAPFKGVTVDPPMRFWPKFRGPANFFEPLSENFKIYISKNIIGFLINKLADLP